jgi:hypothetical protein
VRHCFSHPQPFVPEDSALRERPQFGMARSEPGSGEHGRQKDLPEVLVAPRPIEGRYGVSEGVDGATVLTLGLVGEAEALVRQRLQDNLPTGRGEREGTLGEEVVDDGACDLLLIVGGSGVGCGLLRVSISARNPSPHSTA